MKELSELTVGFVDHEGLYFALAEKLSQSYGRLIYWDPTEEAFDTVNQAVIGDSHPQDKHLERVEDIWLYKKDIDLWIFPDSKSAGMQIELESQGKPVWGSRSASVLEQSRETFIKVLKNMGFEVPKFKRIIGLEALREYLKPLENQIIKISRFRGTMETYKWRSWDDDEAWLDLMAVKLGGVKNIWPFLVFESIDTPFELGGDSYHVRGQFPDHMMDGYEYKDKGYFGAYKRVVDMPPQTQAVMQAFSPILAKAGAINFWSMETRVKDNHFYPIDPTPRAPLPASASQMEMYSNLPTIIAAGAEGELVQPEPTGKFSAECVLTVHCAAPQWPSVRIPQEVAQWVKLGGVCKVNGRAWFPPVRNDQGDEIGWLVAIGDSPREVIETILGYKELLPDGITAHTESLIELLKEIHQAEDEGIEFTPQKLPDPEFVVQAEEET